MLEYCIVNWTLGNMLQWNFSWNWYIFIKNAFEIVFRKLAAILSRRQCVKNVFLHSNCNREITTNGWTCYNPSVLLYCKCSSLLVPRIIECILNHRKICCPLFYVDVISYACPNFNAVSVNILVKEATDSKRNHKGISFSQSWCLAFWGSFIKWEIRKTWADKHVIFIIGYWPRFVKFSFERLPVVNFIYNTK